MDSKFLAALKRFSAGEDAGALVTIINVKGSTPRKPGAKMLVTPDGQVIGTIGGGCGEADVRREALNALAALTSTKYTVNMTNDLAEEEGMVCGGIMEVLIEVIKPGQNEDKKVLADYLEALTNQQDPFLITVTSASDSALLGKKIIVTPSGQFIANNDQRVIENIDLKEISDIRKERKNKLIKLETMELFAEPASLAVELLILGGGHIALPLSMMAKIIGYHVTVVDDRPSFANVGRFTQIDKVICDNFVTAINQVDINSNTFVVIVTRGHRHDKECLQEVIKHPAGYIGMIGSRRRVKGLISQLEEEGISGEKLSKIHSPIGLDIGAETPEEVAVAILAELINVHRGGKSKSLKLTE